MHILIVYATNSGSTFLVAERLEQTLKDSSHDVTVQQFKGLHFEELFRYDLVIWGSHSWDYQKKEGQPHHDVMKFFEGNPDIDFQQRKFALYGLGDKNYAFFTGAVDVMKLFVEQHKGQVIGEPLRINQFYFQDQDTTMKAVEDWCQRILSNL